MNYKKAIEHYEYFATGYRRLSGHSVEVVNVKVLKNDVTADVILHNDEDNIHERHNSCVYPKRFLQARMEGSRG